MSLGDADKAVVLARVAERAERYDEMMEYMKERAECGGQLSAEERDLFSAAFKGALSSRRHALRVAVSVGMQEEAEGKADKAQLAAGYRSKVETELMEVCSKCLALLQEQLVPKSESGEPMIFFLKMQGDYYRYTAEFATGAARETAANLARDAYANAVDKASTQLPKCHPVRLGLALNFSVFQHEVLGDTASAVATARTTLMAAADELGSVPEESQRDASLTLQLLQDNLSLWDPQ